MRNKLFTLALAVAVSATCAYAQEKGSAGTMYMVSNAHLDSQWNWDVQTTINEYVPSTLYRNIALLEKYPDYVFNFEGGVKYWWMKEYYPEAYSRMAEYVRQGRWHISGSSWEASDANIPSTESLTRNILLGQQFYEKEFGVLSTDIFLPDCFGFGQHLPSIAAHCGLIGFSTQKLQWRYSPFYGPHKEPFAYGKWRGIDGNEIYAALRTGDYNRRLVGEDLSRSEEFIDKASMYPGHIAINYYGVGDIGGSPTLPSVKSIVRGVNGDGPLKVVSAASDELFKYLQDNDVPVETFDGELLMDVHGTGCYSSQAAMKLFNRRNELLADAAERSSVAAELLAGLEYPTESLNTIWRRFLWHQFHDDLTGTSIPRAYEFSWNDEIISLLQSSAIENTAVGAVSSVLDTKVPGSQKPLVLYNPSAFERSEVVCIDGTWKIYDEKGKAQPVQHNDGKTAFVATVPPCGYIVYGAAATKPIKRPAGARTLQLDLTSISNSVYRVDFDCNGDVCSIVDLRSGRELVEKGKSIRLAITDNDRSTRWPAWEITKSVIDSPSHSIRENVAVSIVENGPVRKTVRVEKSFGDSKFVQLVHLYEGADADRIDFETEVEWNSLASLLKVEFPLSVSNPQARYDIGLGSLLRDNNTPTKYEVYAHQWADLTAEDGSYGVSILNDCKYGWDKPADNTLRLTLLHTPQTGRSYPYQDHQDLGHHKFTYSIVGHQGSWNEASTVAKAEALNQPLKPFFTQKHKGKLGRSWSLLSATGATVKAVKKAEDGDGYIVRLYETTGAESEARLSFAFPIASVEELNGIEKPLPECSASVEGNTLNTTMPAFGVKTLQIRFNGTGPATLALSQKPLELQYNTRTATMNAFRDTGAMDMDGNSYPSELLPAAVVHRGIEFPLGDSDDLNAIKCSGEEIALPEGKWNKLYLLAAASDKDVLATFTVGTSAQQKVVPYYSGFVGQWGHTGHTEGYVKDADVALVCTHRHSPSKDLAYEFAYMFCIELDVPAGAKTVRLPESRKVVIFSAVAANDEGLRAEAASDLLRIDVSDAATPESLEESLCLSSRHLTAYSAYINTREAADMVVDGDNSTKWCDVSDAEEKFVEFDLGRVRQISGWDVLHAVSESRNYYTRDFCLQLKEKAEDQWQTVDAVVGNTEGKTSRDLPQACQARYVRLVVTRAEQDTDGGCGTVRIYEFNLR